MGLPGIFIPGFSPTLLTTQRSTGETAHQCISLIVPIRVLITSIHNLGRCPCPHCLIPLSQAKELGTKSNILQRRSLIRTDTQKRQEDIMATRKLIYEKNYAIDSAQVEALLKDKSLVLTSVCYYLSDSNTNIVIPWSHRMPSSRKFTQQLSTFFAF